MRMTVCIVGDDWETRWKIMLANGFQVSANVFKNSTSIWVHGMIEDKAECWHGLTIEGAFLQAVEAQEKAHAARIAARIAAEQTEEV